MITVGKRACQWTQMLMMGQYSQIITETSDNKDVFTIFGVQE